MADGVLCRLHAAAAAAGDAVAVVDRPDLDNNDKSRPARKSSHHPTQEMLWHKELLLLLFTELCVYCLKFSQNKKIEKKTLAPILVS